MLLHNIMFGWAILVFLIAIATLAGLLTHKSKIVASTQEPPKTIFDFSAGQVEGRQMQKVLTEALSGSATDAEFEKNFRAAIQSETGLDAETSWAWLGRFLMEYRQGSEFEASPRRLAERFLADIPRRYQLKDVPPEPALPAS